MMAETLRDYDDPVMFGPQQLVSSTKLVRNLSSYLTMVQKKPIFVAREQEVEAVLLSLDDYRKLLLEEEKVKELYHKVLALRKVTEFAKKKKTLISTQDMLKELGLPDDIFAEVENEK